MSTPRDESSGRAEREAVVRYLGKVERCEIGGFHAIGPRGGPPLAYVFGRDDADRILAALASVETEAGEGEARAGYVVRRRGNGRIVQPNKLAQILESQVGPYYTVEAPLASPATEGGEDHDSRSGVHRSAHVRAAPSVEPGRPRDEDSRIEGTGSSSAGGAPAVRDWTGSEFDDPLGEVVGHVVIAVAPGSDPWIATYVTDEAKAIRHRDDIERVMKEQAPQAGHQYSVHAVTRLRTAAGGAPAPASPETGPETIEVFAEPRDWKALDDSKAVGQSRAVWVWTFPQTETAEVRTLALPHDSEPETGPEPGTLRAWAEWLDDPVSPAVIVEENDGKSHTTAGYLLRRVADALEATRDGQEGSGREVSARPEPEPTAGAAAFPPGISYEWVERTVVGNLRAAIIAHGPITKDMLSSAAKRVAGAITKSDRPACPHDSEDPPSAPAGEPTEAEWLAAHLQAVITPDPDGNPGLYDISFDNGTVLTGDQLRRVIEILRKSAAGDDEVATDSGVSKDAAAPSAKRGSEPSVTAAESSPPFALPVRVARDITWVLLDPTNQQVCWCEDRKRADFLAAAINAYRPDAAPPEPHDVRSRAPFGTLTDEERSRPAPPPRPVRRSDEREMRILRTG